VALARKARAGQPDSQNLLRLEAEALRRAGKGDEGAALLVEALARRPDDVSSYGALAEYHAQRRQFDEALAVLARAEARFPADLTVAFQFGSVYERQKRFADAERKFREVLAKDPLHAQALNYLGYMLADRGERLDESRRLHPARAQGGSLQRRLPRQPRLGVLPPEQARSGRSQPRPAAEQSLRDSAVQDHYGDLLFKLGRYEEAAVVWQRALDGDGEQIDRSGIEKKIRSAREKLRKH